MQKKFPNIRKIVILKIQPYMEEALSEEAKYNGFIGMALDCDDISNFPEITETAKNMFGWSTHHIDLEKKVNKGYIPYRFFYTNGEFVCTTKSGEKINIHEFLDPKPQLVSFSIIAEPMYSEGQLAMMDIEHKALFREVEYFHPSGKPMPNGSHYQRGGFLNECKINKESFVLDESVHNEQYGLKDFRGGFVVFSNDVNAVQVDANILMNKVKQLVIAFNNRISKPEEIIYAYSVGNFYKGKYVGDNGGMYNAESLSVEINGLSSRSITRQT